MQDRKEEILQRLQKLREAMAESAVKLRECEFTQLRPVEECLTDWAGLFAGLSHIRGELEGMSPASTVAVLVVGLKAIRVLNRIIDAALQELLMKQSRFSRFLLLYAAGSGWGAVYAYWGTITKHLSVTRPEANGNLENGAEWLVQLIRNLKRLPALFWYSSMASCLVALQMGQTFGLWSVRRTARSVAGEKLLSVLGITVFLAGVWARVSTEEQVQSLRNSTKRAEARLSATHSVSSEVESAQVPADCPTHFRQV